MNNFSKSLFDQVVRGAAAERKLTDHDNIITLSR
jgi:hypothetical protein